MEEAVSRRRRLNLAGIPTLALVAVAVLVMIGVAGAMVARLTASAPDDGPRPVARTGVESIPVQPPPPNLFRQLTREEAVQTNAATPFSTLPLPRAGRLALGSVKLEDWTRAVHCLTSAIYYEAGFEPIKGRRAVAQVVLNRMRHPSFPGTVCGVVYQGSHLPTGCQFTFTCDGALARRPEPGAWAAARAVAEAALSGHVEASVGTATHYHTDYVVPYWAPSLVKLTQVGTHIFYRWPGRSGESAAFSRRYQGGEPVIPEAQAWAEQPEEESTVQEVATEPLVLDGLVPEPAIPAAEPAPEPLVGDAESAAETTAAAPPSPAAAPSAPQQPAPPQPVRRNRDAIPAILANPTF